MGRAAQAGVEGANAGLDAIEHALGNLRPLDVMAGDLGHGPVHGQVVLTGGDDQVDPADQAVVVDLVVMEQRAPGRLADAHALEPVDAGDGTEVVGGQVGVVDHSFDELERGQDLDQPGVVVEERRGGRAVEPVAVFLQLLIGQRARPCGCRR